MRAESSAICMPSGHRAHLAVRQSAAKRDLPAKSSEAICVPSASAGVPIAQWGQACDPEQWIEAWERRTAAAMVKDLEQCGADQDLEALRAAWSTPAAAQAAAQRNAAPAPSRLNRRGDLAARRLGTVEALREVAEGRAPVQQVTEASVPGLASLQDASSGSSTAPTAQQQQQHLRPPPQLEQARQRRSNRGSASSCLGPSCQHPDDADEPMNCDVWAAWEQRWAQTFRQMEHSSLGHAMHNLQGRRPSRAASPQAGAPKRGQCGLGGHRQASPGARARGAGRAPSPGVGGGAKATGLPGRQPAAPLQRPPSAHRFADFAQYEVAWAKFAARIETEGQALRCTDVPWPLTLPSVSGISAQDTMTEQKKKLRDALLRWHPDKWARILEKVKEAEKPRMLERVKEVTLRILAEKDRLS